MNLPLSLTSLLETLEIVSDSLREATEYSQSNVWWLVQKIRAVKNALKDVEIAIIKFIGEENDKELKEKVEDEVYEALLKAENILYPDDYGLDMLVFFSLKKNKETKGLSQ